MRFFILSLSLFLIGCTTSYPPVPIHTQHVQLVNYIHAGDEIRVVIMDETSLSDVYKVDAKGEIALPMVGSIKLDGLTLSQAGNAVSKRLENGYLKHAQIATSFVKQRDIYVLGEVQRPGNYPYSPDLTVIKAIAQAGGYTYRAKHNTMILRRQDSGSSLQKYTADEDSVLHPGDSIMVQERWF